jgi:hypothetical protein
MGVGLVAASDRASGDQAPDRRRVRPGSGRLEEVQKVLTGIRRPAGRTCVPIGRVRGSGFRVVGVRLGVAGGWLTWAG